MDRQGPARGFTLVELVVTVAVMALVLVVGIPSMLDSLEASRVRTAPWLTPSASISWTSGDWMSSFESGPSFWGATGLIGRRMAEVLLQLWECFVGSAAKIVTRALEVNPLDSTQGEMSKPVAKLRGRDHCPNS